MNGLRSDNLKWASLTAFSLLSLLTLGVLHADGGAFQLSAHGNATTGVDRDSNFPAGSCAQCHTNHVDNNFDYGLYMANDNNLCYDCHQGTHGNAWPGDTDYAVSSHGSDATNEFPTTGGIKVNRCTQCHNPHGNRNTLDGLYPSQLNYLEEGGGHLATDTVTGGTCYSNGSGGVGQGCHGSNAGNRPGSAKDIYSQFQKTSSHPLTLASKKHSSTEARTAGSWNSGTNRHVECVDCHNPHMSDATSLSPGSGLLSSAHIGTWGVEMTGTWPAGGTRVNESEFTAVDFADTDIGTAKEYELCFKCHSSYAFGATPPSGSTDVASEFNPNNLSYHPVVATIGTNSYTQPTAANANIDTMEAPWDSVTNGNSNHRLMSCSDCHSSETPGDPAGPHGSTNAYILRAASSEVNDALCFECHREAVYNAERPPPPSKKDPTPQSGSRFDHVLTGLGAGDHYEHSQAGGGRAYCRDCHGGEAVALGDGGDDPVELGSIHGTNLAPKFYNGVQVVSYSWPDGAGGTCDTECHSAKSWDPAPE